MYPEIIHNSTNKYETKKELSKTPKEKGINVKYLLHIVKVTLIFFVIVGMTVYFLLTLESCLKEPEATYPKLFLKNYYQVLQALQLKAFLLRNT